jgi:alanine racemase
VGDEAVLWGWGLAVEEIAEAAGTIAYELLTGVTDRVPREHLDGPAAGDP